MGFAPKNKDLHIRIKDDLRQKLEIFADIHDLTLSSLAHQILNERIRAEEISHPKLFATIPKPQPSLSTVRSKPVFVRGGEALKRPSGDVRGRKVR